MHRALNAFGYMCSSRILGGLKGKTAVPGTMPAVGVQKTGDLARTAKTQLSIATRDEIAVKLDLRCLSWAINMHTRRSWTIPAPS